MILRFLLLTLAAGLRLNNDPMRPWEDHPASTAEELQELLTSMIAEAGTVQVPHKAGGAEAQEVELRKVVADMLKPKDLLANMIHTIWQSSSTKRCHQQLEQVMGNLTLTCEGLQPKADWLLDYYASPLPNKTCTQSVSDIFASGDELVSILQVSRSAVASLDVSDETLRRYQALSFLRNWLVNLTRTHHHALIWAGFWDGDPQKRTTKGKLSNFAKSIEHATMHPDSFLGQVIEGSQNLDACYEDAQTSALAGNMWSIASMSFVLGMREKAQGTVIALVNKKITGERNLSQSVLSTHEIPTVGLAAWGLGFWSPKVIVVDLMGTCSQTSPALQKQLFARLPTWAKSMKRWSAEAFARRSRLQWQCIDCSGTCSLDDALAEHVEKLVKAKEAQDRKDQELRQATRLG
ncbi:Kidins220 [Symbiodinium sp. KB8]|nr:Kidins220 [Symbiodinium sp. KB8]